MNKRHFLGSNRGPFDPGRDIMMGKHKLDFKQAYTVDATALAALARAAGDRKLVLRAVDGYAVTITAAQAAGRRRYGRWSMPTASRTCKANRSPSASPIAHGACITSRSSDQA
ncbi:MAG: hypothetical protein V4633_23415 [Pseudomonadota bacterium]